jgi:hypothetical protein
MEEDASALNVGRDIFKHPKLAYCSRSSAIWIFFGPLTLIPRKMDTYLTPLFLARVHFSTLDALPSHAFREAAFRLLILPLSPLGGRTLL